MTDSAEDDPGYPVVWLWDAGSCIGVAGSEPQARESAEARIGASGTAVVEMARIVLGPDMVLVYERTGVGLAGAAAAGRVSWAPLRHAA